MRSRRWNLEKERVLGEIGRVDLEWVGHVDLKEALTDCTLSVQHEWSRAFVLHRGRHRHNQPPVALPKWNHARFHREGRFE